MNTEVRDALPDLLHGRLSALDTATMTAHVESCADCRAELEILRKARTEARLAPRMDAARIAAVIPAYGATGSLRLPARQKSMFARFGVAAIAMVAVVIAAGSWAVEHDLHIGSGPSNVASRPEVVRIVATRAPAITTSPAQKRAPAAVASAPETQVASLSLVGTTSDLSDDDLEQLVAGLDDIEPMPAAEPPSVTPTVENIGSDNDSSGF